MSMPTLSTLLASLPQEGRVQWIGLRPARRTALIPVAEVEAREDGGLIGDRYDGDGRRGVTLIQAEHLAAVAQFLNRDAIDPGLVRRNVLVRGINLVALSSARFSIGEVLFQGTGRCHPCSRMEENLGAGGYNAMRGHGGITARVLKGGRIRVGDVVRLEQPGELPQNERD
jgi:MOSC domain-containing protein YiiM